MKEVFTGADWWMQLSPSWKQAFGETFFHHTGPPSEAERENLYRSPALRLAGPSAPYPNMSFELTDLTGIESLVHLEILIVTHHLIESVRSVRKLTALKGLFVYNNRLTSLEGIEQLLGLEQLFAHCNRIDSIAPVEQLTKLREVYINNNRIALLEGLKEEHADNLETFFCRPNDLLKQKEIMRVEKELGIRCRNA